uniref:non-specific serine/threonine protein kinase n=1 Tax=Strongyloides papillosus TaxID=174720 RepID=A0A0N5C8R2_STREA
MKGTPSSSIIYFFMDNSTIFSWSPEYRFSPPNYDTIEEYCDESISINLTKQKTPRKRKGNKDNSVVISKKPRKSKKLVKEENKKKYEEFMKAVRENNSFKDQVLTEEGKKLRDEIFESPNVSDVVILYEPDFKSVRDIGLQMATEEELEESYKRVHSTSSFDKLHADKPTKSPANLKAKPTNLHVSEDTSSHNVDLYRGDSDKINISNKTMEPLTDSGETLESLEENGSSGIIEETEHLFNSTSVVEETNEVISKLSDRNKQTVVEELGTQNSAYSDDGSIVFVDIKGKDTLFGNRTLDKQKNDSLPERDRILTKSSKKPRRNVPVRRLEFIDNSSQTYSSYFGERSSSRFQSEISGGEISQYNSSLLSSVKNKFNEGDYSNVSKRQLVESSEDSLMVKDNCSFNKTQEYVLSSVSTLDDMLRILDQEKVQSFRKLFPPKIVKIGEGSFGEVYCGRNSDNKNIIYKVTPFEPDSKKVTTINGTILKGCREITMEYMVTNELSKLNYMSTYSCDNFVKLYKCTIVNGMYPKILLDAWKAYKRNNGAFNDDPTVYRNSVKHFLVFELEDAGIELEKYFNLTKPQAYSIIFQLIHCLRIAEEVYQFEHRDLHESNILIQDVDENANIEYKYNLHEYRLKSFGVKVKIIDYTLSRMSLKNEKYYLNLEEVDGLFNESFNQDSFQFIYPKMRELLDGDWSKFCSKNNILWISYHVKRLFSFKNIRDQQFLDYFKNDVSKMECLEELFNDEKFIEFQKDFIV